MAIVCLHVDGVDGSHLIFVIWNIHNILMRSVFFFIRWRKNHLQHFLSALNILSTIVKDVFDGAAVFHVWVHFAKQLDLFVLLLLAPFRTVRNSSHCRLIVSVFIHILPILLLLLFLASAMTVDTKLAR